MADDRLHLLTIRGADGVVESRQAILELGPIAVVLGWPLDRCGLSWYRPCVHCGGSGRAAPCYVEGDLDGRHGMLKVGAECEPCAGTGLDQSELLERGTRRHAVACALWFGFVPTFVYESSPHHDMGYLRHLRLNLGLAWRWATYRESFDDRLFEAEVNGYGG